MLLGELHGSVSRHNWDVGQFLPDVSINAVDRAEAVAYYRKVFSLQLGREGEHWTELLAGPFRFFVCDDGMPSGMFAYAAEDPAATVRAMLEAGGKVIKETEGETFVTDAYGITVCVESA